MQDSLIQDEPGDETFLSATALDRSLGYKLRLAQILAYRHFEERMTEYGVAPRYLGLLGIVAEHPGQPQNRLADAVGLQKSSLVTILDRLEKDGILRRRASPTDRRAKTVWLTDKGRQIVAELLARAQADEQIVTEGITPEKLAEVMDALDIIIANLRGRA